MIKSIKEKLTFKKPIMVIIRPDTNQVFSVIKKGEKKFAEYEGYPKVEYDSSLPPFKGLQVAIWEGKAISINDAFHRATLMLVRMCQKDMLTPEQAAAVRNKASMGFPMPQKGLEKTTSLKHAYKQLMKLWIKELKNS